MTTTPKDSGADITTRRRRGTLFNRHRSALQGRGRPGDAKVDRTDANLADYKQTGYGSSTDRTQVGRTAVYSRTPP